MAARYRHSRATVDNSNNDWQSDACAVNIGAFPGTKAATRSLTTPRLVLAGVASLLGYAARSDLADSAA